MTKIKISVEKLFELGAHFGHQVSRSNPKAKDFVYTQEGGVLIFDLPKTKELLSEALLFWQRLQKRRRVLFFLAQKDK